MSKGPYDLALARTELLQMAASEEAIRWDHNLTYERDRDYEKKKQLVAEKRELSGELVGKLAALQKKHIQAELDQWGRGEDKFPSQTPREEVTRRIRQRYDFREEDVL